MSKIANRLLIAACLVAAPPALADTGAHCWDRTTSPGVFDWAAPPSIACRDREALETPATAPRPGHARTRVSERVSAKDEPAIPGTTITFSGQAYVGTAWAF